MRNAAPTVGISEAPQIGGGFDAQVRNRIRVPHSLLAQVVPNPTATAVSLKRAVFDQYSEMLLKRVAAYPGQPDGLADSYATMFAGKLDDL